MLTLDLSKYPYPTSKPKCAHHYLFPFLLKELSCLHKPPGNYPVFEIGCGNGATAAALAAHGYQVGWGRSIRGGNSTCQTV
jgi:2-polyprenyl-6-hydroxyphenyl methylase/3-demethylubiquinone-9 3-methyltransferase